LIYVITAFSRPQFLDNLIDNFERQSYSDKKLIIIENGDAIGTCKSNRFSPDVLLSSDNHQSFAKNAGIEYIRKHGGGWWSTFDDDDYYGPGYLTKVSECFDKADIIGQSNIFVRSIGQRLRLMQHVTQHEGYSDGVHGSTISARAEDCPLFRDTGPFGEDWDFINRYRGAKIWSTPHHGHMLVRHNKNTWQIQDDSMVRRLNFSTSGKGVVKDFGPQDGSTLDIVNGIITPKSSVVKPDGELRMDDSQAYVELMKKKKKLLSFEEEAAAMFSKIKF